MLICKPLFLFLDQPELGKKGNVKGLTLLSSILQYLNTPVTTVVPVGKESRPVDFPIVNHTITLLVHFGQSFRAKKIEKLLPFVLDLLPVIPRESEFAQIILNIEEFFCSDVREAAIHFILVHALQQGAQCQRAETLFNLVPATLDDFFSKQICLFVLEKVSSHPDLQHHTQTWAPLDTVKS